MRFVRNLFALLLLVMWPAVTSHSLLEHAGVIHEVHADHHHPYHHHDGDDGSHEHKSDNHDFADGRYFAKTSGNSAPLRADICLYAAAWMTVILRPADVESIAAFGPAPPGVAPLELNRCWSFLLRTAVDARAPSFLS